MRRNAMNQRNLRLGPVAGNGAEANAALIDDRLLLTVAAANDAFLRLAADCHARHPGAPAFGIAAHQLQSVAAIGHHRRNALAALPYAVFDLRLRDDRWWSTLAGAPASVNDALGPPRPEPRQAEFARFALMFAWHVAQLSETASRLVLGAGDAAIGALAGMSLGAVDSLAGRVAGAVGARFAANEVFWRLFVQCSVAPRPDSALALRLLGLQLMGMEAARVRGLDRRARRLAVP
jgi:hypothetical protein